MYCGEKKLEIATSDFWIKRFKWSSYEESIYEFQTRVTASCLRSILEYFDSEDSLYIKQASCMFFYKLLMRKIPPGILQALLMPKPTDHLEFFNELNSVTSV